MKYPIGIQEFGEIRQKNFVYVDKTDYIYRMVDRGKYYFLSRPRRFGKSLLLSTIKAYFEGKRELFEGLALEQLEKEWTSYPVLHLDLNVASYKEPDALTTRLSRSLDAWEQQYGYEVTADKPHYRFESLLRRLHQDTGKQVVILVDEYDKPMLQSIGDAELQDKHRSVLKAFYSVLKTCDAYIRFAFLTGVTKFGKVSVFSDLNNLMDISMLPQFNGVCGITESELHRYFEAGVAEFAAKLGKTVEDTTDLLRYNFDGYHFVPHSEGVYNPFSLLNTLESNVLKDYWFETGTPTFLVELLKRSDYDLRQLQEEIEVDENIMCGGHPVLKNLVPLIYYSGYLTIKDFDSEFRTCMLGIPNHEIEQCLVKLRNMVEVKEGVE